MSILWIVVWIAGGIVLTAVIFFIAIVIAAKAGWLDYAGVGVLTKIRKTADGYGTFVTKVMSFGPAAKILQYNDRIVAVDGVPLSRSSKRELKKGSKKINGKSGSVVTLGVERWNGPAQCQITRERIRFGDYLAEC